MTTKTTTPTTIDLIAGDCKALLDEVALKAQYAPHEEFRYAWEQLQGKLNNLLSAVYGSPYTAKVTTEAGKPHFMGEPI